MSDVSQTQHHADFAQFQHNANNQRVRWRYPTANGGGSSLESQWHDAVYDHRWRQIEVRRDESVALTYPPQYRSSVRYRMYCELDSGGQAA